MTTRYQFIDDSGETRLAGTLNPDPAGFTPARNVGQCSIDFSGLDVAAGVPTIPAWSFGQGDNTMLSLTNPQHPAPIAAGTYAIAVDLNNLVDTGTLVTLQVDEDWYTLQVSSGPNANGDASVGATWFVDAGSAFHVVLTNANTELPNAQGTLYVQRIT